MYSVLRIKGNYEPQVFPSILHKLTPTTDLIYGKCHDYIRLLVDDFSFSSWVAQISLHLEKAKRKGKHQS